MTDKTGVLIVFSYYLQYNYVEMLNYLNYVTQPGVIEDLKNNPMLI